LLVLSKHSYTFSGYAKIGQKVVVKRRYPERACLREA